jgi:AraC family transcriptional regulator
MTDLQRLPPGRMLGRTRRAVSIPGFTLVETVYDPGEILARHAHEEPNLCLVVGGSFDERAGARDRTCTPGQLLTRAPGEVHGQRFLTAGARCFTLEPAPSGEAEPIGVIRESEVLSGRVVIDALRLYDQFRRPRGVSTMPLEELAVELLATAIVSRPVWRSPRVVRRARELIHAECHEPLSVAGIASRLDVHRVHLSRAFRREMGCTISDYLRRVRVHRACETLCDRSVAASTVAASVGFSDESHLIRCFRGAMACTPGEYRGTRMPKRPRGLRKPLQ